MPEVTPTGRITAEELDALATVLRKHGIVDFASGDTRIILSAHAPILTATGINVDPMRPIEEAHTPLDKQKLLEEEEDLLFAAT
jgi:3',5'-cyclic AMP phosphodiesterase CpdA